MIAARFRSRVPRRAAFTLVEVLIVVVILAILAATVLPQFTNASKDAIDSSVKQNLSVIRSQIELYRIQHGNNLPGADFENQMTLATDRGGDTTGTDRNYGPYVSGGAFPVNQGNEKRGVFVKTSGTAARSDAGADDGWIYEVDTGRFYAADSDERFAF